MKFQVSKINYLVAVPLVVMSVHLYEFFETDHWLVRLALAVSFDVLVIALFYLLKDEYIKKNAVAMRMTWTALFVLIGFQVYVNVWAYWELNFFRAVVSGAIFPTMVGMISYIGMMREEKAEAILQRKAKEPSAVKVEETAEEFKPVTNGLATKEEVISALKSGADLSIFKGVSNWRSVKRWAEAYQKGAK